MATEDPENFRAELLQRLPWWLKGWLGFRIAYAIGVVIDVVADMLVEAAAVRFPRTADPDALPYLGADRKIPRGPGELVSTYIVRLRRWLDDHRTRGGPYAMLAQLHAYWGAAPFQIQLVYANGVKFVMATDGTVTRTTGAIPPEVTAWPFWWLIYDWPNPLDHDGLWSSPGTWSDGGVWDSSLTPVEVETIRLVPTAWNAVHATGEVRLVDPFSNINQISINN